MISGRLKEIIFNKLYNDLSRVEIIEYKGEIWFIDRENKSWYFIYNTNGTMWWKYDFFFTFFEFFSITDNNEFDPILSSWVEEVLNCKVSTTWEKNHNHHKKVEEVLNCKVTTTTNAYLVRKTMVEEVLNCKVSTTIRVFRSRKREVEEVLNCKVSTTGNLTGRNRARVEEVLNCKVSTTFYFICNFSSRVEEVLKL